MVRRGGGLQWGLWDLFLYLVSFGCFGSLNRFSGDRSYYWGWNRGWLRLVVRSLFDCHTPHTTLVGGGAPGGGGRGGLFILGSRFVLS